MSRIMSFIAGAVSVGAVVGVLAVAGAFDSGTTTSSSGGSTATTTPTPTTSVSTPAAANSVAGIYQRVSKGVVFVENDQGGQAAGSGSGFVIDTAGHIVTNEHVVENGDSFRVRFGENGDPVPAKLLGADKSNDLAVLQVDPSKVGGELQPVQLGNSEALQPGQPTIAIGSPFGLEGTVTSGIVSALDRTIQAPNKFSISGAIQTDAAINPGNSGGPLIDASGRVIGVNSQIRTGGGNGSVGIGFAVPIDTAKRVIPQLQRSGKVERGYLGVETRTIDGSLADLNLPVKAGALVQTVTPGSPAAKAGIHEGDIVAQLDGQAVRIGGDIIVAVDGRKVRSSEELVAAVTAKKGGDKVKLDVLRDGKKRSVEVQLVDRPQEAVSQQTP